MPRAKGRKGGRQQVGSWGPRGKPKGKQGQEGKQSVETDLESSSDSFSSFVRKINETRTSSSEGDDAARGSADAAVQLPTPDATSESAQKASAEMMQKHAEGICDPCLLLLSDHGCPKGQRCEYCHFPHNITESESARRPGKRDRLRIKASIQKIFEEAQGEDLHHELQWEARSRGPFTRKAILSYLNEFSELPI